MDYNIYIRNLTDIGGNRKPTQPRPKNTSNTSVRQKEEKPNTTTSGGFPVSLKNFKSLPKGGKIGIAIAVVSKVAQKVLSYSYEVANMYAADTGNYVAENNISNMMALLNAASNPIGQLVTDIKNHQRRRLDNQKIEQQRLLTGDVFINSSVRKV